MIIRKWIEKYILGLPEKKEKIIKVKKSPKQAPPVCAECGGALGLGVPVTSNEKGMIHKWCE